jgi:hypothetical protein
MPTSGVTDTSKMPSTTIGTYLGISTDGTSYKKLIPIKDFPDLGGAPDQVEITDLDDDVQKFLLGVQSMSALEFTANYIPENYDLVSGLADGTIRKFCVAFGSDGEYGVFTWEGQISVWVTGGGVNAAREMKVSISAVTKVLKAGSTVTFDASSQYTKS